MMAHIASKKVELTLRWMTVIHMQALEEGNTMGMCIGLQL